MVEFDFIPNWIYTVLIIPIIILFKQQFTNSSRLSILENKDRLDDLKIKKICDSNENLAKEINQMLGAWREHLRKSPN